MYKKYMTISFEFFKNYGINVLDAPQIDSLIESSNKIELKQIKIEDLLSRDQIDINLDLNRSSYQNKTILVTGAAGFIGFHVCHKLVKLGFTVVGLDNINDYYDVNLKYARLHELGILRSDAEEFFKKSESSIYKEFFSFVRMDLVDDEHLPELFKNEIFYRYSKFRNDSRSSRLRYS